MNTARKGNAAELRTADWLKDRDWVVGFRRHEPGPGDLTANRLGDRALLIEVKSSSRKRGPYADFPPADREALRLCAVASGMVPLLAWKPQANVNPQLLGADEWPG